MIVGVFGQTVTLKSNWINSRLEMVKKLIDWDLNYANAEERKLASIQNVSSRIIDLKL